MKPLPVLSAAQLPQRPPEKVWLIDKLWANESVGLIGGPPKTLKTYLALEMAISVATATPCLGRFAVPHKGRVLLFAAEDATHILRARIESLARAHDTTIGNLDIGIIDTPHLKLDKRDAQENLHATITKHKPALLILDPFVRLHMGLDENSSRDVASLLGFLRSMQRHHNLAIVVVHHTRKSPAQSQGYELRGSGDFFAWGDCFLYLSRKRDALKLSVEHRAAAAIDPVCVQLSGDPPHMSIVDDVPTNDGRDLESKIISTISASDSPMSTRQLQNAVHARTASVLDVLHHLKDINKLVKTSQGWSAFPVSHPRDHRERKRSDQVSLLGE